MKLGEGLWSENIFEGPDSFWLNQHSNNIIICLSDFAIVSNYDFNTETIKHHKDLLFANLT